MKKKLTERNIAIALFAFTIFFFSLAQRNTVKLEKHYRSASTGTTSQELTAVTDQAEAALPATE